LQHPPEVHRGGAQAVTRVRASAGSSRLAKRRYLSHGRRVVASLKLPPSFARAVALLGLSAGACTEPQFDSGQPDASEQLDSSLDAGAQEDASASLADASKPDGDSGAAGDSGSDIGPCRDDPATPGHDCPGVLTCHDVGTCEIGPTKCCQEFTGLENVCTTAPACSASTKLSLCDGPEDCEGSNICCLGDLFSYCTDASSCTEPARICHSDADCKVGHCKAGTAVIDDIFIAKKWGFCRG
jgi:hypothetical protein